jgi:hypothetical protein
LHPVFTVLHLAIVHFLQSKVVSLASNSQPGGPGLCIYVPQRQSGPVIVLNTGFPFCPLFVPLFDSHGINKNIKKEKAPMHSPANGATEKNGDEIIPGRNQCFS